MGKSDPLEGMQPFKREGVNEEALSVFLADINKFDYKPCMALFRTAKKTYALYGPGTQVAGRIESLQKDASFQTIAVRELPLDLFNRSFNKIRETVEGEARLFFTGSNRPSGRDNFVDVINAYHGPDEI